MNLCSDPHEEFAGKNCLIERESIEETASAFGLSVEETEKTLARARELLHERRMQRPRPHLDDKARQIPYGSFPSLSSEAVQSVSASLLKLLVLLVYSMLQHQGGPLV